MISLDSVLENIIAQIIVIGISFVVSKFAPKLFHKDVKESTKKEFNLLSVGIFLVLVSGVNLVLNISFWNDSNLTILLSFALVASIGFTGYVYKNQCPSCKKLIHAKKTTDKKVIKTFTRPYPYTPMKIYYYSNGEEMKREPMGKEKKRTEHYELRQDFFECRHCNHKWDSGQYEVNLDEATRKDLHKHIKTKKKDPDGGGFYNG